MFIDFGTKYSLVSGNKKNDKNIGFAKLSSLRKITLLHLVLDIYENICVADWRCLFLYFSESFESACSTKIHNNSQYLIVKCGILAVQFWMIIILIDHCIFLLE